MGVLLGEHGLETEVGTKITHSSMMHLTRRQRKEFESEESKTSENRK